MNHKKPTKHKKEDTVPTWLKLQINGETLDVLKVWQLNLNDPAHRWPETAILRARTTNAKQQVEDDTVLLQFLNQNDIFSKDVNEILPRVSVPPGPVPCKVPHWNFVAIHGKASNTVVIEVPCFK
jgi:hypothetical protein